MARRAAPGIDPAAPVAVGGRAGDLRGRYAEWRRRFRLAPSGPLAGAEPLYAALSQLAVGVFADWVVVDLVDDEGATIRAHLGHDGADDAAAARALGRAAPGLAGVIDRVIASGDTETWPEEGGEPRAIVVGLRVKDRAYGSVSFVLGPGRPSFDGVDVTVAEEVAWGVGAMIERAVLQLDNRRALRATQRMARQLHQLFAATVTVSGIREEREIARAVAQSARRIFDAESAVVVLEREGVTASVNRGQARATFVPALEAPVPDPGDAGTVVAGEWLSAVVGERPGLRYGLLAVRRGGGDFATEDREIATLLAQAAATALGTTALSRGVERSEARLRTLVETAPVGIVEVDAGGVVRWWNRAAERIFGWPPAEGGSAPSVPAAFAGALAELAAASRSASGPAARDLVDVTVRGRSRDLTTSAALVDLPDEDGPTLMVLVDDVTDHRQLKAEVAHAQQMELRGRVASTVAHDFNNLLTLISGYAELLSHEMVGDRLLEMVHDIHATTSRASMLTAQLQSIGRTQALEPAALAPVDVVRANAEVLERIVGHDVELELVLDDDAGAILVDAAQFEQMLLNLAVNARDAMPDGGRLRIAVERVEVDEARAGELGVEPGPFVSVTVSDTGVGMDEETMARCFDAFFTTKGPLKGTGLGLASARRLVEASGGSITVRAVVGAGATFEAFFPITREAVVVELASATPRRARGYATVLVVEDDGGLRRLMDQVLARNGYTVLVAESGEEALERADAYEGPIDLLVSDVVLGGMSGPEVATRLQRRRPGTMVLLTSGTADRSVIDGLSPGTAAFLAKPFRPSALIDGVHELLARRD